MADHFIKKSFLNPKTNLTPNQHKVRSVIPKYFYGPNWPRGSQVKKLKNAIGIFSKEIFHSFFSSSLEVSKKLVLTKGVIPKFT